MALFANKKQSSGDSDNNNNNSGTENNVGFIPPLPPSTSAGVNPNLGMSAQEIASKASEFVTSGNAMKTLKVIKMLKEGDIAGAAKEVGLETASQLITEFQDMGFEVGIDVEKPKGPGGGGFTPDYGTFNNSYANATRLSIDPEPTEVRLNTGIKPDTFTPDYQITESGYASPLHISCLSFAFPSTSAGIAGTFLENAVMFDLRNKIQKNITFSLPSQVTNANLVDAMNKLIYALSIYYSVTRLLVYGNNPMNRNEALLYLRGTITASVGDDYLRLKRLLDGLPIPPNLNTLVFYLHQIYSSSHLPGSPCIMICPHSFTNGVPTWSEISTAVSNLTSTGTYNFQDLMSTLGRAIPNWYSTKLYTGVANPLHDDNFTTIWTNAPYWYTNTAASVNTLGPTVSSFDGTVRFNSWTNNLDGAAFALTSVWNSTASQWIPSLLNPFRVTVIGGSDNTSRISWYTNGTTSGFYSSSAIDELVYGRDETYTTSYRLGNTTTASLMFGSERCWAVTGRTVTNAVYQVMDWCMSWSTIPTRVDKNLMKGGQNPSSSGVLDVEDKREFKSKKRRKKGKGGK